MNRKGRIRREFTWLTILRILTFGGAVFLGALYLKGVGVSLKPLFLLLFIALLSSYGFWLGLKTRIPIEVLFYSQLALDVLMETAIVYYTGGARSDFTFFYFFTIVLAAVFLLLKGSLIIAMLSTISYSLMVFLERYGVIPQSPFFLPGMENGFVLLKVYLNILFFFLVAVLSAYIAEKMVAHGRELEITKRILKQIKLDTTAIVENIPSGLIAIDSWGNVLYFNKVARKILNVEGKPHWTELHEKIPEFAQELSLILSGNRDHRRREIIIKKPDGKEIPLGLSHAYLYDESGQRRGAIVVFQDLSEYKEMEWELRRLDRLAAIGEFSAHLAHEIRNPLTAIRGSIEMLKGLTKDEEAKSLMSLVLEESDKLNRIVTDFLRFARIPSPSKEKVDMVKILSRIERKIRAHIPEDKEIEIIEEFDIPSLSVKVDEGQIEQVIFNLLTNAVDAIEKRGKIFIRLKSPGSMWMKLNGEVVKVPEDRIAIQIQDTGSGIPQDVLKKIFEPFFTTKKGGTGLGLSVVQRIVSNHGGEIKVESKENGGTLFTIYIPLEKEP
jgi:two-component system sensor histidine kinase PilS (NtrC family)